jgi:hypothetical protein
MDCNGSRRSTLVRTVVPQMRVPIVCGIAWLFAACGTSDAGRSVVAFDSAGVQIVRSHGPVWSSGAEWSVASEPILSLGAAEGDAAFMYHGIAAIRRLSDGRIVVADDGSATLRYYDAAGRHLLTVGRRGSGPGEFQRLSSVQRLTADSLFVWDSRLGRISLLDGDGGWAGELAVPGGIRPATLWRLGDGRWVAAAQTGLTGAGGPGLHRQTAYLIVLPPDLTRSDTVATFPGTEYAVVDFGSGFGMGVAPYGRAFAAEVYADEVYIGIGDWLGWETYSPDGTLLRRTYSEFLDLRLSERDRPAILAAALEEVSTDEERGFVRDYHERVSLPAARRAFSSMLVDATGAVWFEDGESGTGVWRVHAASGEYLGQLRLPVTFEPHEIGEDYLLGVWRDDLGVETVRMFRLLRG